VPVGQAQNQWPSKAQDVAASAHLTEWGRGKKERERERRRGKRT
jgi:hypothetical protein